MLLAKALVVFTGLVQAAWAQGAIVTETRPIVTSVTVPTVIQSAVTNIYTVTGSTISYAFSTFTTTLAGGETVVTSNFGAVGTLPASYVTTETSNVPVTIQTVIPSTIGFTTDYSLLATPSSIFITITRTSTIIVTSSTFITVSGSSTLSLTTLTSVTTTEETSMSGIGQTTSSRSSTRTATSTTASTGTGTSSTSSSSESSAPTSTSLVPTPSTSGSSLSTGEIVGIALGAAIAALLIVLAIFFLIRASRKRKRNSTPPKDVKAAAATGPDDEFSAQPYDSMMRPSAEVAAFGAIQPPKEGLPPYQRSPPRPPGHEQTFVKRMWKPQPNEPVYIGVPAHLAGSQKWYADSPAMSEKESD